MIRDSEVLMDYITNISETSINNIYCPNYLKLDVQLYNSNQGVS